MNAGLTPSTVNALAIDPSTGTLYAGTGGGGVFDYQTVIAVGSSAVLPPNHKGTPRLVNPRR